MAVPPNGYAGLRPGPGPPAPGAGTGCPAAGRSPVLSPAQSPMRSPMRSPMCSPMCSPMQSPGGAPLPPGPSPRPQMGMPLGPRPPSRSQAGTPLGRGPSPRLPMQRPGGMSPRPPMQHMGDKMPYMTTGPIPHPAAGISPAVGPRVGSSPGPLTANRRRAYPAAAFPAPPPSAPPMNTMMHSQAEGYQAAAELQQSAGAVSPGQPGVFVPGAPDMPTVGPSLTVNKPASYDGPVTGSPSLLNAVAPADANALAMQMGGLQLGHATPSPGMLDPAAASGAASIPPPRGSLLSTINLSGLPPDPQATDAPPPAIQLPPGANPTMNPLANADPVWQRCTLGAIPTTAGLLAKTSIPLGLILTPYRSVPPPGMIDGVAPVDQVPLVDDPIIVRCRKCRVYINPFVEFTENGNRWKCSICGIGNEVPSTFDWDYDNNQPRDRWSRPELNSAVVEFVAPREYMVRPPQAPTYVFLIDVTVHSIRNGMVAQAAQAILDSLDEIPNADGRTRVGFVAVDHALHFFAVPEGGSEPEMLVVSDLEDPFLPKPTDILMNLSGARAGIEALLKSFPNMFANTVHGWSGMGSALQAAFQLISPMGGKIVTLTSTLPTLGIGALKVRSDPNLLGTAKESTLLQAGSQFYKTFPIDCARSQVSVDVWLFNSSYADLASFACLSRYTGGETFFYPNFDGTNTEDATKFHAELNRVVSSPIGLEAILRVRASRGIRPIAFHGNFFVRSTDLLAMSAVPLDQSYAIELEIEENIKTSIVLFQSVLLYSTSFGERRIRVVNLALPTTTNMSEVYVSADQQAITMLLANKSVEHTISHRLEDARDAVFNKLVDIFTGYKHAITGAPGGVSAALNISQNLALLPLLVLSLLKNVGLKDLAHLSPDLRAYAQALLTTLPGERVLPYLLPNLYSLHNMPPTTGMWAASPADPASSTFLLPPRLSLTSEKFERYGLYLIENGLNLFLWLGRDAVPQLMIDVFGVNKQADVPSGKSNLPKLDNRMNVRVRALIDHIRSARKGHFYPALYVVKEGGDPALRLWALSQLVEDRDPGPAGLSYTQFLNKLRNCVNGAK